MLKNEKGLTLVEILASIVILSIVLTSFYGLFIQSAKFNKVNEDSLIASNLANRVREVLITNKFENIFETTGSNNIINIKYRTKFNGEIELDSSNNFVEYPDLSLQLSDTDTSDGGIDKDDFELYSVKIEIIKNGEAVATTYCYVEGVWQ